MLYLVCTELQAWPIGGEEMSGLHFLRFYCKGLQEQDLAAFQQIPHVTLGFSEFSTLFHSTGSWQSLQIWGVLVSMSGLQCRQVCERHGAVPSVLQKPGSRRNVQGRACGMHEAGSGLS